MKWTIATDMSYRYDWVPKDAIERYSPDCHSVSFDIIEWPGNRYIVVPEMVPAGALLPEHTLAEFATFEEAEAYVVALCRIEGIVLTP